MHAHSGPVRVYALHIMHCRHQVVQVCENYIDAERIPEQFPGAVKADEVLSLETVVLGGLNFDLVVYHPYTFLDAMIEVR